MDGGDPGSSYGVPPEAHRIKEAPGWRNIGARWVAEHGPGGRGAPGGLGAPPVGHILAGPIGGPGRKIDTESRVKGRMRKVLHGLRHERSCGSVFGSTVAPAPLIPPQQHRDPQHDAPRAPGSPRRLEERRLSVAELAARKVGRWAVVAPRRARGLVDAEGPNPACGKRGGL